MRTSKKLLSVLLAVLLCVSCFSLCLNAAAVTELSSIALACPAPEAGSAFPTVSDVECAPVLQVKSIIIYEVQGNTSVKATAPFEVGKTYEINFSMATRTANYNFSNDLTASVNDEACNAVYLTRTTANVVWTVTVGNIITKVKLTASFKIRAGEPLPALDDFGAWFNEGRVAHVASADFYEYNEREELTAATSPFKKGKTYVVSVLVCPLEHHTDYKFNPVVVPELELYDYHWSEYIETLELSVSEITRESLTVKWSFKVPNDPVLTLLAEPAEGGTILGAGGAYPYVDNGDWGLRPAEVQPFTAVPNDGYYFDHWEEWNGSSWERAVYYSDVGHYPTFPFTSIYPLKMDQDRTYRAVFVAYDMPDLTGFTKLPMYPFDTMNPSGWYFDSLAILAFWASILDDAGMSDINPQLYIPTNGEGIDRIRELEGRMLSETENMSEEERQTYFNDLESYVEGLGGPVQVWYNAETGEIYYSLFNGKIERLSDSELFAEWEANTETPEQFKQLIDNFESIFIRYAEPTTYTVTANASAGGSATGGNTYDAGATATVTATPNSGYHFTGWYEGSTKVSDKTPYSFTVTKDVTLTAQFEKDADSGNNGGNNNPQPQPSANRCHWCGKTHDANFFQKIIGFFHNILAKIFGNKY